MRAKRETSAVPVIDVSPLVTGTGDQSQVASEINRACREMGFFYMYGHGIPDALQERLAMLSRQFFSLPTDEKLRIRMELAGRAWRGYFPVGAELTSGSPDLKEGIYFGAELGPEDSRVRDGLILHGANLFPERPADLKAVVLDYMSAMTRLGHTLMKGLAMSLGLDPDAFAGLTKDPLTLFRIFHYPSASSSSGEDHARWGVGEHTDYGMLTILKQDDTEGLQVKTPDGWISAPGIRGTFVCNIGDMLDRLTGGYYRSTPHRVRNHTGSGRLSFPFFFDPAFDAEIRAIDLGPDRIEADDRDSRWDRASVHDFRGTYGEYLLSKIGKVFPELSPS